MNYPYNDILILIGLGLSTFLLFKKEVPFFLKAFSPFLTISLIVELSSYYLANKSVHTLPLYNIFGIIEFCFYLWVLKSLLRGTIIKKTITFVLIGFPFLCAINMLFFQGINNFNSISYSSGCLVVIFFSIFFFFELFSTQIYFRLSNNPAFWICTGLLFYYSVSFPIFISVNLMKHFTPKLGGLITFVIIVMNIILYSLFCVAFICQLKLKKGK